MKTVYFKVPELKIVLSGGALHRPATSQEGLNVFPIDW